MCNATTAELADLVFSYSFTGSELDPGEHGFAQPLVGKADHINIRNLRMAVEELLDFAWIYVFAAANNHFFQTAGDMEATVSPHGGEITGVQPAFGIDGARGGFGLPVVTLHHEITSRA